MTGRRSPGPGGRGAPAAARSSRRSGARWLPWQFPCHPESGVTTLSTPAQLLRSCVVTLLVAGCSLVPPTGPPAAPSSPSTAVVADPSIAPTRITADAVDATIGRYGRITSATFRVRASGVRLRYRWRHQPPGGGEWVEIAGATKAAFTAKAADWADGTSFRVEVSGRGGTVLSAAARLTVLWPTTSPAADAEAAFGLTGLSQGVDLSSWQHTPQGRVRVPAIADWAGAGGFALLRNGSGARPRRQDYTDACTAQTRSIGKAPITRDCAYPTLAGAATDSGLRLGHYWFNGWISSIDTTKRELFAGGYTPKASAAQFVTWLTTDGNYTRGSTDPLVLDVEAGRAWTKTDQGKTYELTLRAWNPGEAAEFLTTVKQLLTRDGYQANLYVYMSANAAAQQSNGAYVWTGVAGMARLWVAFWGTNNGRIPDTMPSIGPWAYHGGWSIWQYSSNVRIAGSGVGALDGDLAKPDAWTPR